MDISTEEVEVIVALINDYQGDGAKWAIDGIWLDDLKNKIRTMAE